ncbi:hypothetical protein AB205_0201090 [Aquarana catesbeiana]|uniref:Uncharacterized protein n=1 Tax=Aquarana catesbeiana TaxID=8400 RepID=A0A2G9QAM2_AQUCT|nr:hypothetical protein AB205_0201090 [Aquarana catesbeiana]
MCLATAIVIIQAAGRNIVYSQHKDIVSTAQSIEIVQEETASTAIILVLVHCYLQTLIIVPLSSPS